MKKSFLTLSKKSVLEIVCSGNSEQLELAANELERLVYTRFGEIDGEDTEVISVNFKVAENYHGFSVRVADEKTLVFTAPSDIEIVYAVYDFAEEYLGYCFFEPGVDNIETFGRSVKLEAGGKLIANRVPALKHRGFVQEFPFSEDSYVIADWMVKNKLNYIQTWMKYYDQMDEDMRDFYRIRGIEIESGHHNFSYLIPTQKYGESHPEFFAEIGGKRIKPKAGKNELLLSEQLCTTNPALREELVKNLMEYSRQHPEVRSVGLVPNDGFGWCECKECSKYYDKNIKGELYSLSEHVYLANKIYHELVRYVNRRLREEGCELSLTFCAYINYCAPSPGFELAPNMRVCFANYWRCINHPIYAEDCPVNSRYAQDIKSWSQVKKGGEIMIYEYLMGVNFYISLPMVHTEMIFDEVKFYKENGVDGFITQFHLPHWSVYGINYYAMAQALYGKSRPASLKRMWSALFGKDMEMGKRFYKSVRDLVLSAGKCHIPYPYALFSRTDIEDFEKLHRKAANLCKKCSRDSFRQDLKLWTEYLVRFKRFFDDYNAGRAGADDAAAFQQWAHDKMEGRLILRFASFDFYFKQIVESLRSGKKWIHFGLDWEDAYIIKHHNGILSK